MARDLYGKDVKVFNSVEELVEANAVDLLIVNSPNGTHYPYAKARRPFLPRKAG